MTQPTTEELARRALETVARTHGVPVSDVHAAVRRAAEHTEALGALTPEELVAYMDVISKIELEKDITVN